MRFKMRLMPLAIALLLVLPVQSYAQEREWLLDAQGEDTFIMFGVPNTTDMGLSLWCKIGEKSISLFAPIPRKLKSKPIKVALKLDSVEFPLQPKFSSDQGKDTFEAELTPRDEILAALKSSQRIGLHIAEHNTVFPTAGADFDQFARLCESSGVSN